MKKIIRIECRHQDEDRDLSLYELLFIQPRRSKKFPPLEYYQCIECEEQDKRDEERWAKMMAHNRRQKEDADERSHAKFVEWLADREKRQKEQIWDCEVIKWFGKKIILKGTDKYRYMATIPKEVLQYGRACMKLERLIEKRKSEIKESIEKEEENKRIKEDIEKLKIPVITCIHHGKLFLNEVNRSGKEIDGSQKYKCRQCQKIMYKEYYKNNKDYVAKQQKKYKEKLRNDKNN